MKRTIAVFALLCAFAAGCSKSNTSTESPHASGKSWVTDGSGFHGASFRSRALDCTECHDVDSFCLKCHFNPSQEDVRVPPGSGWQHPEPGGAALSHANLAGFGDVCNTCHRVARSYGVGPAPCHDCHGAPTMPHLLDKDWFIPGGSGLFHGTTTAFDCAACHSPLDSFCVTCHFTNTGTRVPVGSNWAAHGLKDHAGSSADLAPSKDTCVNCHTITNGFIGTPTRTGADCTNCHGFAMHTMPYATAHQPVALADLRPCRQCHDTPTQGGVPNFDGYVSGVACTRCHADAAAHPFPWYTGHRSVGSNWTTVCAICHNTQSATPATGPYPNAPSCFSSTFNANACHSSGPGTAPHPLGQAWLDPAQATFHGSNLGLFNCQSCHDQNTFCSTCHFGPTGSKVPPGVSWTHGRYPHALDPQLVSQQAVCIQCHTLMKSYSGKPTRVDCSNCHGITIPHGSSFIFNHTRQDGMDLALCQRCHGQPGTTQFGSGVAPLPDCANANCHPDAKAHPTPWRFNAGDAVSHMNAGNIPTACAICHYTVIDNTGTPSPVPAAPACSTCHPTGFVPHAVPFTAPNLHGAAAKANLNFCQTCHSDNPTGGPGSNPRFNVHIPAGIGAGLANGCEDCHTARSAHATNWQGQDGNKLSHRTAGSLPGGCNICHGADLTGSPAIGSPSCFSASFTNAGGNATACHFGGYLSKAQFHPDLTTWVTNHQPLAGIPATLATCYECHDANGTTYVNNVLGFNNVPGCSVCHFGPTGSRVPAGVNWTHGTIPHDFLTAYAAICNACHSVSPNAPANVKAVTCTTSCHAIHVLGQPWMDKKSATFHGLAADADLTSCQACHGADYRGGTAGVSCYTCHFSPTGDKSPTGAAHVNESLAGDPPPHAAYSAYQSVCNACHNTNRTYGNLPGSCHDCH